MRPIITPFVVLSWMALAAPGSSATAPARFAAFSVPLSGEQEVNIAHPGGGTGDMKASGLAKLSVEPANRRICYDFRLSIASEPMMAHIHAGLPLRNGPPVIILFTGTGGKLSGCAPSTHGQLAQIVADPSHFYVSVDTTQFPDGALRGQL